MSGRKDPFEAFGPVGPPSSNGNFAPVANEETAAAPPAEKEDPFDSFGPVGPPTPRSAVGAFASHAAAGVLPTAAGLTAAGYGAAQGAELGAFAGPWGALAGGLVGGIGGFMGASYATEGVQHWAVKQAPTSWQDALGQSDREQRLQEQQHPYASFLGGLAPYAVTMSPGGLGRAAASLPEDATAFQRVMANPMTSRLFGGGAMGGMELGQEEWNGETPNWAKVGIATGFGMVFNKPNQFGEFLAKTGHEAAVTFGPLRPKPVTLAEAGDLGVMGPGITESTFMGGHEQSPESKITAQNTRSDEIALTEPPPEPDLNAIARRIDPETMAHNDELLQRREDLLAFIKEQSNPTEETFNDLDARQYAAEEALRNANPNGPAAKNFRAELSNLADERAEMERRRDAYGTEGYVETPDVALARQHLMETEHALWDHAPAVRATLRRAAEHAGQHIEEPATEAATEETPAAETPTTGALTPAVRMADGALHVAKEGETHADLQSRLQTEHPEMRPVANAPTVLSERGYVDENGKFLSAGEARARQAGGTSETVPPTAPTEPNHIAQIVAHSTAKQEAAGVPPDQAVANATVEAHFYDTLSKRFGGKLGSALDLYNARSAEVVQGGSERAPAAPTRTRAARGAEMPGIRTKENGEPVRRNLADIAHEENLDLQKPAELRRAGSIQDRELGAYAAWQAAERAKAVVARESPREPLPEERTLAELDARNAPDEDYKREINLSTWTKEPLKADETWRSRAVKFIDSIRPEERELNQGEAQAETELVNHLKAIGRTDVDLITNPKPRDLRPGEKYRAFLSADGSIVAAWPKSQMSHAEMGAIASFDKGAGHMPTIKPLAENIHNSVVLTNDGGFRVSNDNHLSDRDTYAVSSYLNRYGARMNELRSLEQGRRGYIDLDAQRAVIHLLKDANASTFMHETAHHWLEQLLTDSEHPDAPNSLRDDADIIRQWLGVNANEDVLYKGYGKRQLKIRRDAQEKFATGFEQYLREGKAPSKALEGVFAKFKEWLLNIYKTLRGLGTPINDEIKGVFDRMLAHEPEPTVRAETSEHQPSLATVHETDAAETSPRNAENVADRVASERNEVASNPPPEVKDELDRAAADAGAENGAGATGSAEVAGGVPAAEPVTEGGGVGAQPGKVSGGGGKTPAESGGVSAGTERGAGRSNAGSATGPEQLAPKPAESLRTSDDRLVDKAGNIRVENLTDEESVRQALHDSADRNAEFQQVRGLVTDRQVLDLANAMAIPVDQVNKDHLAAMYGGFDQLAPKIVAARKLVVDSANIVHDLWVKSDGSDAATLEEAKAIARHDMIQATLSKMTAETGRALRAFQNLQNLEKVADVNQILKDNLGRDLNQLKMIAKLGKKLDTPAKVSKWLRDAQKRSFPGMVLEYWINGLISGLAPHTTYTVGNELLGLHAAGPETAAAALIGSIRQSLGRPGERVYMGEVMAQLKAHGRELPAALQASIEAARTGMTTRLPSEVNVPLQAFAGDTQLALARNMTNDPVTWREARGDAYALLRGMKDGAFATGQLIAKGGEAGAPLFESRPSAGGQIPNIAIRGVEIPVGELARLPSRMVATIHSFFRATNYSMEINRLAYRTAVDTGHSGTALAAETARLRQSPTDQMMERANYVASERTLMGQGGAFTQALQRLTNVEIGGWKLLKFVDPFVHIASNIMEQALVERTPIGLLSRQIREDLIGKNGNVAQDTAQAKMLVGTAMGITFGGLAANGYVSGSGPSDPHKAAVWREAGNQAHSVRIGDMWYDMHRLGPMGMLASVSADLFDVSHAISEYESGNIASAIMHAFTQNILDESFMRGPSDLIKAVEEPDRYGSTYVRNMVASFMPYSVAMSQMARAADPYSRQARTIMDTVKAHTPGLSETLLPRRTIWGEPMPNPESMAPGILAIYQKKISTDPVNQALVNLGIGVAPVKREIMNVKLTDEQYDDFARIAGGLAKQRLNVMVNSPQFHNMNPATQHDVIEETIRSSRTVAQGHMFQLYPQIPHDAAVQVRTKHTTTPEPIH